MVDEKNSMFEYLTVLQAAKTMIFGSSPFGLASQEESDSNNVSDGSEGDGLVA